MDKIRLRELAGKIDKPLVSIYLPTHETSRETKQDAVRYKNLLTQAENKVKEMGADVDRAKFFAEADKLKEDTGFWNQTTGGLAVLIDKDETQIMRLHGKVEEKVVVGDRFHILPLLNYYESPNDYYLLDISRDRFVLYSYIDGYIHEMETPDIYNKFTDLFDDKDLETRTNPTRGREIGGHGHQSKPEVDEKNTEKYFRYVADELGKFIKADPLPIILFGTTENAAKFANIATHLDIYDAIDKPLHSLNQLELYEELKKKLLPKYIKKIDDRINGLNTEIGQDRGSGNATEILWEAGSGRIDNLFVSTKQAEVEKIDELVSAVIHGGGEIIVVDPDQSSFDKSIAATYRY